MNPCPSVKSVSRLDTTPPVAYSEAMSFANDLKKARGTWSHAEAAALLGCSKRTYENWEQGRRLPDPFKRGAILERMARAGLSGGSNPRPGPKTRLPARAARTVANSNRSKQRKRR